MALPARFDILSLFSGGGGLDLGLHLAVPGARTVGYVEREAYAAAVLVARMESEDLGSAPVWDDVATFDGGPFRGLVDCVAGGFPCQDISNAGNRVGIEGERSGLWTHFARVIREVRPRYVFVENVAALVVRGLDVVLGDLSALGFDAEWLVLGADDVGAPHQRERLFLLAHAEGNRAAGAPGDGRCSSIAAAGEICGRRASMGVVRDADDDGAPSRLAHADSDPVRLFAERDLQGQAERLHAEPRAPGARVADTARGGLGELREPSGLGGRLAERGGEVAVADAAGERERKPDDSPGAVARTRARLHAGGRGGIVGDPALCGRDAAPTGGRNARSEGAARGPSCTVADSLRDGLEGLVAGGAAPRATLGEDHHLADANSGRCEGERVCGNLDREREGRGGHPDGCSCEGLPAGARERGAVADTDSGAGNGLPDGEQERRVASVARAGGLRFAPFPPGPDDREGWEAYLARWPGTEPAVRRGTDGLAHRMERLRLLGNGVVPQQAAAAFEILWERLHA